MRQFSVSHGRDGWSLALTDVKPWAYALEWLTDGPLCLCKYTNRVEWVWKVPVGRPRRDEDGFLENSIGGVAYSFENGLNGFAWRRGTERLGYITLTTEQARDLSPEFVKMVDGWGEDGNDE